MEKSKVALVTCKSYDNELVYQQLKKAIDLVGGINSIVNKDEKILLKPNLLKAATPDKAITTHPAVFRAIARILKENGFLNLSYGDSCSADSTEKAADLSGIEKQAEELNVKLGDFKNGEQVIFKEGKVAKKFIICKEVIMADAIISISKMKTHALENITGAIKNQYGYIFLKNKAIGHAKYPNSDSFAKMLIDLNMYKKPRLFIMDGIIAMEGNGPASGDPTYMNLLLVSKDPVALDSVFAKLINLNPSYVPTCTNGEKMGLGNMNFKNISIISEDGIISEDEAFKKYGKADFNVNRKKQGFWRISSLLFKSKPPKHRPVVDLDKCIACGICEKSCPVEGKAVISGNGLKAKYDYTKCIRCYCCQENCPAKAISREEY